MNYEYTYGYGAYLYVACCNLLFQIVEEKKLEVATKNGIFWVNGSELD